MTRVQRATARIRGGAQDDFLGIARIIDGQIVFRGGERSAVVEVVPIDLNSFGPVGEERLYLAYRPLIHSVDFPFQLLVRKARNTLDAYLEALNECLRAYLSGRRLARLTEGHAAHVQRLVRRRTLLTTRHFVVVPDSGGGAVAAASGALSRAGAAFRRILERAGLAAPGPRAPVPAEAEEDEAAGRRLADRCALVIEGLAAARLAARRLDGLELARLLQACYSPDRARLRPLTREQYDAAGPIRIVDLVAPGMIEVCRDAIRLDESWARVLAVKDVPRPIAFAWQRRLLALGEEFDVSYHFAPRDSIRESREIRSRLGRYKASDIADENQGRIEDDDRQLAKLDNARLLNGINRGVEKPWDVSQTVVVRARRREELDAVAGRTLRALNAILVEAHTAYWDQDNGLHTALPEGRDRLRRTFDYDSTSAAMLFPFDGASLAMPGGVVYGLSAHDAIVVDPFDRDPHTGVRNGNFLIAGTPGSGKSAALKTILVRLLARGVSCVLIDQERAEYDPLCYAAGGRRVALGGADGAAVNPFDLPPREHARHSTAARYAPVEEAVAALMPLLELMTAEPGQPLGRRARAILDEALFATYAAAGIDRRDPATWGRTPPLLADLDAQLARREGAGEMTAAELRHGLHEYVHGALAALFDRQTTVGLDDRLVVFNIHALPATARLVAIQAIGDFVGKQMRRDERRRIFAVDEAWKLLKVPAGATFLETASRQFRKYNGALWVSTQQFEEFNLTDAGRTVLAQAEMKIVFGQDSTTIEHAVEALRLTPPQRDFLLGAKQGQALLFAGERRMPLWVELNADEAAIAETNPDRKEAAWDYLIALMADLPDESAVIPGAAGDPAAWAAARRAADPRTGAGRFGGPSRRRVAVPGGVSREPSGRAAREGEPSWDWGGRR